MEIEVVKWSDYNPRTDRKSSWFRVENSIMNEPKFFGLTPGQKFICICIFAEVSKAGGAKCQIHVEWMADMLKVSAQDIYQTIQHLERVGVVKVSGGVAAVTTGCPTNERTNVTNERDVAYASPAAPATSNFIAAYCQKFKARWGVNPEIKGKNAGIAKRLAKGWSSQKAEIMLDAFFSMPDAQLVKAKHPLTLLEYKLNEVTVWADSGQFTTQRQAVQADQNVGNAMLLQKIREGKL